MDTLTLWPQTLDEAKAGLQRRRNNPIDRNDKKKIREWREIMYGRFSNKQERDKALLTETVTDFLSSKLLPEERHIHRRLDTSSFSRQELEKLTREQRHMQVQPQRSKFAKQSWSLNTALILKALDVGYAIYMNLTSGQGLLKEALQAVHSGEIPAEELDAPIRQYPLAGKTREVTARGLKMALDLEIQCAPLRMEQSHTGFSFSSFISTPHFDSKPPTPERAKLAFYAIAGSTSMLSKERADAMHTLMIRLLAPTGLIQSSSKEDERIQAWRKAFQETIPEKVQAAYLDKALKRYHGFGSSDAEHPNEEALPAHFMMACLGQPLPNAPLVRYLAKKLSSSPNSLNHFKALLKTKQGAPEWTEQLDRWGWLPQEEQFKSNKDTDPALVHEIVADLRNYKAKAHAPKKTTQRIRA